MERTDPSLNYIIEFNNTKVFDFIIIYQGYTGMGNKWNCLVVVCLLSLPHDWWAQYWWRIEDLSKDEVLLFSSTRPTWMLIIIVKMMWTCSHQQGQHVTWMLIIIVKMMWTCSVHQGQHVTWIWTCWLFTFAMVFHAMCWTPYLLFVLCTSISTDQANYMYYALLLYWWL